MGRRVTLRSLALADDTEEKEPYRLWRARLLLPPNERAEGSERADGSAIAAWGRLAFAGRAAWQWKRWIDTRFVAGFR